MVTKRKTAARRTSRTHPSRRTSPSPRQPEALPIGNYPDYSYPQRSKTSTFLIILVVILAFFTGYLYFKVQSLNQQNIAAAGSAGTQQQQKAPALGAKVNIDAGHLPVLGDKNAKVTVIEFADFQCPFCKRFFDETETNLVKDYINTGKVKFYFRHYAFLGQESTWAAEAAECANEQSKFWEYHDYLYSHQGQENSGTFSKTNLEGFAETLGLNTSQFNSCLESDKYLKNVQDDLAAGQKTGVSATPTSFINGKSVEGAIPYSDFKNLVDKELAGK